MPFVYILFSQSKQIFYSGQSEDPDRRFLEHNSGKTPSIKHGIPWEMVWKTEVSDRSEAVRLENKIKKRGAKRFLNDLSETVSRGAEGAKVVGSNPTTLT